MVCLSLSTYAQEKVAGCYVRMIEPTKSDTLIYENETAKISFEFNSFNYFVSVAIKNKTNEIIQVNWDDFLLIYGSTSYPIIFDDTVMAFKEQPKGCSNIAPGTSIFKKISAYDFVEYGIMLFNKKEVKKYGNRQIGFIVPIVCGENTSTNKIVFEASLK